MISAYWLEFHIKPSRTDRDLGSGLATTKYESNVRSACIFYKPSCPDGHNKQACRHHHKSIQHPLVFLINQGLSDGMQT